MKNNFISFIMPVYNTKEKYLDKSIKSILSQKNKNYELLIIDDGSNEQTKNFLKKYDKNSKIKIIYQNNSGVSSARNNGILNSSGEWLAFIDADDWVEENYVDTILNNSNDVDIIMFDYCEVRRNNFSKKKLDLVSGIINSDTINEIKPSFIHKLYLNKKIQDYAVETIWNKVYRKCLIKNEYLFEESLKKGEDRVFNLKIFNDIECKIKYIDKSLYNYLINEISESNSYTNDIILKTETTLKSIINFLSTKNFDKNFYEILNVHICTRIYSYLRLYYLNKNSGKSYKEIRKELNKLRKNKLYSNALNKVKFNRLNFSEKIFILFFKYKCYDLCILLSFLKMKKRKGCFK